MTRKMLTIHISLFDHGSRFTHRFEARLLIQGSKGLQSTNPMATTASDALEEALKEARKWVGKEEESSLLAL